MKISKLPQLLREIKLIIKNHSEHDYPVELEFNEGMEHPTFQVIIQELEKDHYIDSNGVKWVKVKDEDN